MIFMLICAGKAWESAVELISNPWNEEKNFGNGVPHPLN
jgi:hypothetical protein